MITDNIRLNYMDTMNPSIDNFIGECEIAGIDIENPELMGGLFKKIFKRIRKRIREKRARKSGNNRYSLSIPSGKMTYNPKTGFQILTPDTNMSINPAATYTNTATTNSGKINIPGIGDVPIIAVASLPLLIYALIQKKNKKK